MLDVRAPLRAVERSLGSPSNRLNDGWEKSRETCFGADHELTLAKIQAVRRAACLLHHRISSLRCSLLLHNSQRFSRARGAQTSTCKGEHFPLRLPEATPHRGTGCAKPLATSQQRTELQCLRSDAQRLQ